MHLLLALNVYYSFFFLYVVVSLHVRLSPPMLFITIKTNPFHQQEIKSNGVKGLKRKLASIHFYKYMLRKIKKKEHGNCSLQR